MTRWLTEMLTIKSTTTCQLYGHPEFEIEFDPEVALQTDVDLFVSYLIDQVANGVRYEPNQLIQVGWMMVRVEKSKEKITLFEPDFEEFPIKYVRGVTNTFRDLRLQKSTAESVGLEDKLDFPTILHSGISCTRHEDSMYLVMDRTDAENRDSGWFIGCDDPNHDHNDPANLRRTSLYELVRSKPGCILFLALPTGSFIRTKIDSIEIQFEKRLMQIKEHSFLEKYLKQFKQ